MGLSKAFVEYDFAADTEEVLELLRIRDKCVFGSLTPGIIKRVQRFHAAAVLEITAELE